MFSYADFFFPNDGSEAWLQEIDAHVSVRLLSHMCADKPATVLEVGVWKAAWTSVMLRNCPQVLAVGIDPYPMAAAPVRAEMLQRIKNLGLVDRFALHASWGEIDASSEFSMIHVDGEHSEQAALHDLECSLRHLAPGGVVIVDDFRNKWYPGVSSALYHFCRSRDMRIFLTTDAKAYVARAGDAERLYADLLALLKGDERIQTWRWFRDNGEDEPLYPELTDVLGQPVLIARRRKSDFGSAEVGTERSVWSRVRRRVGRSRRTRD